MEKKLPPVRAMRTLLTAGVAALVTCAVAVLLLVLWRGSRTTSLASLLPTDGTIAVMRLTADDWENAYPSMSALLPPHDTPRTEGIPGTEPFDIAFVKLPESDEVAWILRWMESGTDRFRASDPSLQERLTLRVREEGKIVSLEAYRAVSMRARFAMVRMDLLRPSHALRDQIAMSLLGDFSHLALGWDEGKGKGLAVVQRKEAASAPSSPVAPLPAPEQGLLLHATFTDPVSLFAAMQEHLRATHPETEEGMRGILLHRWETFLGRGISAEELHPLFAHPVTVLLYAGSGETLSYALSGRMEAEKDTLFPLLQRIARNTSGGHVREVELLRGQVYRSVIGAPDIGELEPEKHNGWALYRMGEEADSERIFGLREDAFLLANDTALALRITQKGEEEDAHTRGTVSLPWLRDSFASFFPFLTGESSIMPWELLRNTETLSWELTHQRDTVTLRWEARR